MQVVTRTFTPDEFAKAFQGYFDGAQKILDDAKLAYKHTLTAHKGRRYIKLVDNEQGHRRVFAFIDITNGDILKPEGWSRPAMHARGNIFDADFGLSRTRWTGPEYLA